ncbi:MAG: SRPBCC family protein [Acidimicrobiales bacterium]
MDVTATLDAPCLPGSLFPWVEDLARYPDWLDIVPRAEPVPADAADPGPAWQVDLRGRFGPLARSKRLRMVRTEHDPPNAVRFERRELDGRRHSPWRLTATVEPGPDGSRLTMHLHYGGGLWGPLLERMLGDEIEHSKPRLLAHVAD